MSSSCIEADYLGDVRLQRIYRCISALNTDSYVMEVKLEEVQEGCRNARA